jgi:hypothetical protein
VNSDLREYAPSVARRHRVRDRLAKLVSEGRDFVVLLAHDEHRDGADSTTSIENPPFVQFAWRDDLRLQIEVQGDHYRDSPYNAHQHRLLRQMGFVAPFEAGDEFCNWTMFREAEGCEPTSAATCMIDALWWVHGVNFHPRPLAARLGAPYWHFQWSISPSRMNLEEQLRRRYLAN